MVGATGQSMLLYWYGTCMCMNICFCWRASEASETLSGVYEFELVRYVYIYIYMYGGTYVIIVAHATHM